MYKMKNPRGLIIAWRVVNLMFGDNVFITLRNAVRTFFLSVIAVALVSTVRPSGNKKIDLQSVTSHLQGEKPPLSKGLFYLVYINHLTTLGNGHFSLAIHSTV